MYVTHYHYWGLFVYFLVFKKIFKKHGLIHKGKLSHAVYINCIQLIL